MFIFFTQEQASELLRSKQAPNSEASPQFSCCVAASSKFRSFTRSSKLRSFKASPELAATQALELWSFSGAYLLRCSKLQASELGAALAAQLHPELATRSCAASAAPFRTLNSELRLQRSSTPSSELTQKLKLQNLLHFIKSIIPPGSVLNACSCWPTTTPMIKVRFLD
jgi:hypothetical protein